VALTIAGRPTRQVAIRDISRGGAGLDCDSNDKLGTIAKITLPGGNSISGRISGTSEGLLGISFFQDKASLAMIDQTLASLDGGQRAA
jgi:hypothetical protein